MPVKFEEMMEACRVVSQQEEIEVCVTESLKGASVAGVSAFTLGVILGPLGLALGGALGGFAGSRLCKKYKPLYQILNEMSQDDKMKLFNHMMKIIQGLEITDGLFLIALVTNPEMAARKVFIDGLRTFAQKL